MAFKQFLIGDQLTVKIYKRKSSRSLKLSIASTGEVRVSIPLWAPYSAGITFAKSKLDWILSQQKPATILVNNQPIGKAHHLVFEQTNLSKVSSRIVGSEIRIKFPISMNYLDLEVQKKAANASIKALRSQAEQLLPQRLITLADQHGFSFKSVSVKKLKSRWGSCDQKTNIVLNLYLMQLPWECIDYVLIHELVHTKVMRHGPDFWQVMGQELSNLAVLRKQIKQYHPILLGSQNTDVA